MPSQSPYANHSHHANHGAIFPRAVAMRRHAQAMAAAVRGRGSARTTERGAAPMIAALIVVMLMATAITGVIPQRRARKATQMLLGGGHRAMATGGFKDEVQF